MKSPVSVISLSSLSPKSIPLFSACDTGAGPQLAGGMFSFAGWRNVRVPQQRATDGPRGQEDPSLLGPSPALLLFLSEEPRQLPHPPPQRAASPAGCMLPVGQGLLNRWES